MNNSTMKKFKAFRPRPLGVGGGGAGQWLVHA